MNTTQNQLDSDSEKSAINAFLNANRAFLGPDPKIMRNHHLASHSAREDAILSRGVDAAMYAEMRTLLQSALDESFDLAEVTVASPAVQCGDMSTGIFTASGDMGLCSSRGVAAFAVSLHYPVRLIRKYFEKDPTVGLREGDAVLVNDCRYGGIHSPDQHLFMPDSLPVVYMPDPMVIENAQLRARLAALEAKA